MTLSIVIAGVGGQGTLLASKILGTIAQQMGLDVKVSEVHGMAQRGGSVVTYVRMSNTVCSPLIEAGGADFLLAFEQLEALRYVHLVKPQGHVVVNTQEIPPMPVASGAMKYPSKILEKLQNYQVAVHEMDALEAAMALGNARVVNTVLLGFMAHWMEFPPEAWLKALELCVPAKTLAMNNEAFTYGYEKAKGGAQQ